MSSANGEFDTSLPVCLFFLPLKAAGFLGDVLHGVGKLAGSCPLQGKAGSRVGICHTSHPKRTQMWHPVSLVTQGWSFSAVIMVWLAPQMGTDSATVWALLTKLVYFWLYMGSVLYVCFCFLPF